MNDNFVHLGTFRKLSVLCSDFLNFETLILLLLLLVVVVVVVVVTV